MPQFIKIEWSGYWDFPSGTYGAGSKEGQLISGEFPKDLIILDSVSGLDYEIDPGKPTYPKSPEPSFMLKNRDNETGIELYPFNYLSTLGRTVEYGGHDDNFADLFIKISSPLLNDRVLFKGRVDDVSHTKYQNEVKINCTDFIGSLSDTNKEVFNGYKFTEVEVHPNGDESESTTESDILNDFYGVTDPLKDHNGEDVNIQRITFRNKFRKYNHVTTGRASNWDETDLENDVDFNDYFDEFVTEFIDEFDNGFYQRLFIDNSGEAFLTKTYYSTGASFQGYHLEIDADPTYAFIKAGKDTILSRVIYQAHFYVIYSTTGGYTNTYMEIGIKTLHMDNGNVEIKYKSEESDKLIIFERGRYLKGEDDPTEAEYSVSGDPDFPNVTDVVIYDWKKYTTENESFIIEDGWEGYSESAVSDFGTDIIVAGIYFESVSSELVPKENIGYFNNVESLLAGLANNLLSGFVSTAYTNLYDVSKLDFAKFCHCYISDPVHYGWIGKSFTKAIVSTARQISGYLYSKENGDIVLHNRDHYDNADVTVDPGFYKLEEEFFRTDSPTTRDFGSKFYKIEYADKIEINNLESSNKLEETVNNSGLANVYASPQDLDVSNYRTTNLGVPDEKTIETIDEESYIYLRTPIGGNNPSEDFFLMKPTDQAIKYAESFPYPSNMFDVSCDVLKGQSAGLNYADIGIGDYLYTEVEGKRLNESDEEEDIYIRKVYLIRRIAYNIPELLRSSNPVKMTLLYVGEETEVIV